MEHMNIHKFQKYNKLLFSLWSAVTPARYVRTDLQRKKKGTSVLTHLCTENETFCHFPNSLEKQHLLPPSAEESDFHTNPLRL